MRAARIVAWLGVLLSVALAPFWVGLLRDVLLVGCSTTEFDGQPTTVCQDGNGYIAPGLPLVALSLLASIALVWLHARFRAQPSMTRWRLQAVPVVLLVGFLAIQPLLIVGVVLVLAAVVTRFSAILLALAVLAFAATAVVSPAVIPLAALGVIPAVVLALSGSYARQPAPPPAAPQTRPR